MFELCRAVTNEEFEGMNLSCWIAEEKIDGERIMAIKKGNEISLVNRRGVDKSEIFPEITESLSKIGFDFVVDGEVVASDRTFSSTQKRALLKNGIEARRKQIPIEYCVFDILNFKGENLMNKPLHDRKPYLAFLKDVKSIEVLEFKEGDAIKKLWMEIIEKDREGIVLKQKHSIYEFKRSPYWLKLKTWKNAELTFSSYENNDNGTITIANENGDRCLVARNIEMVKGVLEREGKIDLNIKYLQKTPEGRYRFIHYK